MSRFDETIEMMQAITSEIKTKASEKLNGLNEFDSDKINIIASKTISVIDEAVLKLQEAAEKISDENELNNFLERVAQKCVEAKDYAIEKFDEIVPYTDAKYEEAKEETPNVEVAQEPAEPIIVNHENIEEEIPASTIDLVDSVLEDSEPAVTTVKEEQAKMEKEIAEVVDSFKEEKDKIKNSLNTLLENENIKYAADFVVSMKDNVVEFMNKPQTKAIIGEVKLAGLKLADKGLDLIIKSMEKNKEEK